MKIISQVIRNINEFTIPAGTSQGYEMLYFDVNLVLMKDYRLTFDIIPAKANYEVKVLIMSRKVVDKWKDTHNSSDIDTYYFNQGARINDTFMPKLSDSYAFTIINKSENESILLGVTLIHTWQQKKESQINSIIVPQFLLNRINF